MAFEWSNVSVYHGRNKLHDKASVTIDSSGLMSVREVGGAITEYTNASNRGTDRFLATDSEGYRLMLKIGSGGGCGCG